MHDSNVIFQNPRPPKPIRPGAEPPYCNGANAAARERELQRIEGMKIAQSAVRGIGISTKKNRGSWMDGPNWALAVSLLFTRATNQRIMPGTEPNHVVSTSLLYNSLLNDSRFMQVPMSHAAPGDIVVQFGMSPDGYAGIVVDHGRIVSDSSKGVQNNSSLVEIERRIPPMFLFRYIGVQKYPGYSLALLANAGFNPDEPRLPAGQSEGGQWTSGMAPSTAILSGRSAALLSDQFGALDGDQKVAHPPSKTNDSSGDASKGKTSDSLLAKVLQVLEEGGQHPTPAQLEAIGEACDAWQRYVESHGVSPFVAGEQIQNIIHNFYNPGSGPNPGSEGVLGFQQGQSAGAGAGSIIAGAIVGISSSQKNSVWAMGPGPRGLEIDKRLGGNLPPGFPTVDRFENGVVTSNKSIDLNAPSYQNMRQLATTLENYTDKVANFNGAARGPVNIRSSDITGRQLQIAIPPGSMSTAQKAVFAAAATEAQIRGVTIIVTEIH